MEPEFKKFSPSYNKELNSINPSMQKEERDVVACSEDVINSDIENFDMGTGVVGRSTIKIDSLDNDMRKLAKNPAFISVINEYVDKLCEQGYNLEDAINTVFSELGI